MAISALRRLLKPGRFLWIIGLIVIPIPIAVAIWMVTRRPIPALWLSVITSKYRLLLPYIVAQSKHETANFTSWVYRNEHNLFGMKTAKVRRQLGRPGRESPEGGTYQHYSSDWQSAQDYLIYLDAVKFPTSVSNAESFALQIADKFRVDPGIYVNGIKRFLA